jgi:hypothetical protein
MRIPWNNLKEKNQNKAHTILDSPKFEYIDITARYFMLDKGCPGDTKTMVKFDGSYWRWIPYDKKWFHDQTLTKDDYYNGHLRSITKDEVEKILNY